VNADIVSTLAMAPHGAMVTKPAGKGIRALFGRVRERLHRHRDDERRIDKADRVSASRKTGALGPLDRSESQTVDVVLHPEAEVDPHVYGVGHHGTNAAKPLNGTVKALADHHEGKGAAEADEPKVAVRDDGAAADIKKP
jgi:hypothetical protein